MQTDEEKNRLRTLYNPSLEDVSIDSDKYGPNPEHYTLKAGEVAQFTSYIADLIIEKLATRMLWASLPGNKNKEKRLKELYDLIEVK